MGASRRVAWVIHPDLGIGGAEMLVVNACVALQKEGWDVEIFTSHHDQRRCFAETLPEGPLGGHIHVHGAWIPRTVFGKFHVVCAVLRMIWTSVIMSLLRFVRGGGPDVVLCDQVSHVVPILRHGMGVPVVFYCHFPDKLLCVDRSSWIKRVYRAPMDWWEETSTGASDAVVVNSKFTSEIFRESFQTLSSVTLRVLYPSIDMKQFDRQLTAEERQLAEDGLPFGLKAFREKYKGDGAVLLSINRFERKKNLLLAIQALDQVLKKNKDEKVHLILAGGYDDRLEENVSYLRELSDYVHMNNLQDHVSFLKSFTNDQRLILLQMARCVLYTPDREHFGIVPIEAMYAGCPVIAVNTGGPLESIQHEKTGFLVPQDPGKFAEPITKLLHDKKLAQTLGQQGRKMVGDKFSLEAFGKQLNEILLEQADSPDRKLPNQAWFFLLLLLGVIPVLLPLLFYKLT